MQNTAVSMLKHKIHRKKVPRRLVGLAVVHHDGICIRCSENHYGFKESDSTGIEHWVNKSQRPAIIILFGSLVGSDQGRSASSGIAP